MNGISKLGKLHLLRHAQTVFLSVLLPDPKQDLRQIWYPNIPNIRSHYEQVSATWHSSNLMISGMGKFYVQIGSAIANQRGIQPITVVGREDENLACTGERFKGVSLLCGIPVYLFNVIQCETNNNSESRILGSYGNLWKPMEFSANSANSAKFIHGFPLYQTSGVRIPDTFSFADAVQGVQEAWQRRADGSRQHWIDLLRKYIYIHI